MRSTRSLSLVPALFFGALAGYGCNSILGLNDFVVTDAGVTFDGAGGSSIADAKPDNYVGECETNAECTDRLTAAAMEAGAFPLPGDAGFRELPSVCVKPEKRCVPLVTDDCTDVTGDYRDDDAIILGTLFTTVGAQRDMNLERQRSATLAAEQINTLGGIPAPASGGNRQKFVMVSCNEANHAGAPNVTVLDRAGGHLINDLHVPAIVGPNTSQDTLDLSLRLSVAAGTVLLTPSAVASSIAELMDNDLTWLMVPSDRQRGPLMINQINQLETELRAARGNKQYMKLGIIYRNDAVGQGTYRSLTELTFNGTGLTMGVNQTNVSLDPYEVSMTDQSALVARYVDTHKPDIIVLAGLAEVVTAVMNPIESRWPAGTDKPHYVLTDQLKGPALIMATTNNADLRTRVRGSGLSPGMSSQPVSGAFELDYRARYGATPTASGAGPSFDATYAIAYALAATRDLPVSGATIAKGLRKLAGAMATPIRVGATDLLQAFSRLGAGDNINAIGTYVPFEWDDRGAVVNGTIEIWCVTSGTPMNTFSSAKLYYDIKTGKTDGAYTPCQ